MGYVQAARQGSFGALTADGLWRGKRRNSATRVAARGDSNPALSIRESENQGPDFRPHFRSQGRLETGTAGRPIPFRGIFSDFEISANLESAEFR